MADISNNRITWIDCAKGIAICLVIIGHTVNRGEPMEQDLIRGLIFSFHMPIFFALSCATFKPSDDWNKVAGSIQRSFFKLIIPAIIVFGMRKVVEIAWYGIEGRKTDWIANAINTFVYSSGVDVPGLGIPALGMLWFLIVLFFSKALYSILNIRLEKKRLASVCIVLSVIGIILGKVQWLPFSFDLVLAVLIFLYFGTFLVGIVDGRNHVKWIIISFVIWISSFIVIFKESGHYLELATREYPLYPLCIICALSGIVTLSVSCRYISRIRIISIPLEYLGRISIWIYMTHAMDYVFLDFLEPEINPHIDPQRNKGLVNIDYSNRKRLLLCQ